MISFRRCLVIAVLATIAGVTPIVLADASTDALKKAPAAVQATVKMLVGSNTMGEFSAEVAGGKTVYDLEFTIKGTNYAADIDPSGSILQREVDIDLAVVPPEVLAAVKKAQPKGTIGETAIATADGKMFYLVETKVGVTLHELKVTATGKVTDDSKVTD